jgi:hypothetical protein
VTNYTCPTVVGNEKQQFTLTVPNETPILVTTITPALVVDVHVGSKYVMPNFKITDPESCPITLKNKLPYFVFPAEAAVNTFSINPPYTMASTIVSVSFIPTDGPNDLSSVDFTLNVINDPPDTSDVTISDITLHVGK